MHLHQVGHTSAVHVVEFRRERERLGGRGPFRAINLVVNGTRLQDLVRPVEQPYAKAEGNRSHMVMTDPEGNEFRLDGSFEGQTTFAVGVDARAPFRVHTLPDDAVTHVVLDIAHGEG